MKKSVYIIIALAIIAIIAIVAAATLSTKQTPPREGLMIPASTSTPMTVKYGTVGNYVSENINSLSPEKPVLGGTFYVTSVKTGNGRGTVSYEDGHIALTADFTYSVSNGKLSIDSFVVRK